MGKGYKTFFPTPELAFYSPVDVNRAKISDGVIRVLSYYTENPTFNNKRGVSGVRGIKNKLQKALNVEITYSVKSIPGFGQDTPKGR